MHYDLPAFGPDRICCDVAIVGTGAAGLTVARELLKAGLKVVLVESGGLDYEARTAALNRGENIGQEYYQLEHARLRFFGGTTAIWGGRCAELDAIDFEKRDWVPHSGWPFSYDELRPYYARAREAFGLPAHPPATLLSATGGELPPFDADLIQPRCWLFDERFNRFTFDNASDLRDSPDCTILTHATVTEIVPRANGGSIFQLDVRSPSGASVAVRASAYVLAAGGIENARLLLASRRLSPQGLGNEHDQVGRYFMEHPHARGGRVVTQKAWSLLAVFDRPLSLDGHRVAPLLTPGRALQQREGLLNTSLTIAVRKPPHRKAALAVRAYNHLKHEIPPSRAGRALWMYSRKVTRAVQRQTDPLRPWLMHKVGRADVALIVRAEQAPNATSRILLSDERDEHGVPRVKLDWRTCDLDVHSVRGLVDALDHELRRLNLGKVDRPDWLMEKGARWTTDSLISSHPIGGFHHMGTTRMSTSPTSGVTDRDGRVHGIDNLYVAGSSLFPTGGWANPTLTIVALAIRSGERISASIANRGISHLGRETTLRVSEGSTRIATEPRYERLVR